VDSVLRSRSLFRCGCWSHISFADLSGRNRPEMLCTCNVTVQAQAPKKGKGRRPRPHNCRVGVCEAFSSHFMASKKKGPPATGGSPSVAESPSSSCRSQPQIALCVLMCGLRASCPACHYSAMHATLVARNLKDMI